MQAPVVCILSNANLFVLVPGMDAVLSSLLSDSNDKLNVSFLLSKS